MPSKHLDLNLTIRKQRQTELNEIFAPIMTHDSYLMTTFANNDNRLYITNLLKRYKESLLKELQFLPIDYDHPLRAAKALANLNDPSKSENFADNLELFNQEAHNSKYYPETRKLGTMIQDLLVMGIIVALLLILPGIILPLVLSILTWVCFSSPDKWSDESPVIQARNDGKEVGRFFSCASKNTTPEDCSATNDEEVEEAAEDRNQDRLMSN